MQTCRRSSRGGAAPSKSCPRLFFSLLRLALRLVLRLVLLLLLLLLLEAVVVVTVAAMGAVSLLLLPSPPPPPPPPPLPLPLSLPRLLARQERTQQQQGGVRSLPVLMERERGSVAVGSVVWRDTT